MNQHKTIYKILNLNKRLIYSNNCLILHPQSPNDVFINGALQIFS